MNRHQRRTDSAPIQHLTSLGDKFMIAFSILVVSGILGIVAILNPEHADMVLGMIASWVSGVMAYYFGRKNGDSQ